MCCFSGDVEGVSNTNIFARRTNGRQVLVYSMSFSAESEIAMVLPLPVALPAGEDAVSFVSLARYPKFFRDLNQMFPIIAPDLQADYMLRRRAAAPLEVHAVGAFDASFVPKVTDFERLDERFRLSPQLWGKFPAYRDYGFAVFKLKPGRDQHVHPMAFTFPSRESGRLFFPTVHLHDGTLPVRARFDHTLYVQGDREPINAGLGNWAASSQRPSSTLRIDACGGLVDAETPCWMIQVKGERPNEDTWA